MKYSLALVILAIMFAFSISEKSYAIDPNTNAVIGEKDVLLGGIENRYVEKLSDQSLNIDNTNQQTFSLGIEDWGPVQISMSMSKYPDAASSTDDPRLCKIVNQPSALSLDLTTSNRNQFGFEVAHMTYMGDILFCLEKNSPKLHGVRLDSKSAGHISDTRFLEQGWTLEITEMLTTQIESAYVVQDPQHNQVLLFFSDKLAFVNMSSISDDPNKPPSYTVVGFTFMSEGDVKFVDAHQNKLFVLSTNSFQMYGLSAGHIESNLQTLIDDKLHQIEHSTPQLRDFEINSGRIEIFNGMTNESKIEQSLYNDSIFNLEVSALSRENWVKSPRISADLLFVAEATKVYIYDAHKLMTTGNASAALLSFAIEISNVVSIRRYHESLYLLRAATSDENSPALEVVEVFLLSNSIIKWIVAKSDTQLYQINRIFMADFPIEEIYVDDLNLYMIGQERNAVAYRGTPSEYINHQLTTVSGVSGPSISHIQKLLVNGSSIIVGMRDRTPAILTANTKTISLQCPAAVTNFNFGDYEIDLNVTTVSCPQKNSLLALSFNLSNDLQKACVLQKTLKVKYGGTTDMSRLTRDDRDGDAVPAWIYVMMAVLVVIVLVLVVVIYRRMSRDKKVLQEMELRTQITHSDMRRLSSIDNTPANRNNYKKSDTDNFIISDRVPKQEEGSNEGRITPDVEDSTTVENHANKLKRMRTKSDVNINVE